MSRTTWGHRVLAVMGLVLATVGPVIPRAHAFGFLRHPCHGVYYSSNQTVAGPAMGSSGQSFVGQALVLHPQAMTLTVQPQTLTTYTLVPHSVILTTSSSNSINIGGLSGGQQFVGESLVTPQARAMASRHVGLLGRLADQGALSRVIALLHQHIGGGNSNRESLLQIAWDEISPFLLGGVFAGDRSLVGNVIDDLLGGLGTAVGRGGPTNVGPTGGTTYTINNAQVTVTVTGSGSSSRGSAATAPSNATNPPLNQLPEATTTKVAPRGTDTADRNSAIKKIQDELDSLQGASADDVKKIKEELEKLKK